MTKDRQKMKRQQFLIQTHHKIDGKFSKQRCLDPVCPERLDPDPVRPERLDPDSNPVNIRPGSATLLLRKANFARLLDKMRYRKHEEDTT